MGQGSSGAYPLTGPVMRSFGVLVLLLVGCHSDPFTTGAYRETVPFVPGPEARIGSGMDGHWSENGGGIVFQGTCYGTPPAVNRKRNPPDSGRIGAMQVIPATGGSISWERCEARPQYTGSTDTTENFPALAMGADGRLLYVELIGDIDRSPGRPSHRPLHSHADLWLSDSASPFTARRKLLTLYHNDPLGHATVPPTEINYLADVQWVGPREFVSLASNLRPDGYTTPFGLVRGTIVADSAVLQVVQGAASVWRWSIALGGATAVFTEDSLSLTLRRVELAGGPVTTLVTIAADSHRRIVDLSCRGDLCLVLTKEDASLPLPQSTFWTIDLSSGAVIQIRADQERYSFAKLSPVGTLVLVGEGDGIHLFSELLH